MQYWEIEYEKMGIFSRDAGCYRLPGRVQQGGAG